MPATTKNLITADRIEAGADFIRVWVFTSDGSSAHSLTQADGSGTLTFTAKFRPSYDSADVFAGTVTVVNASGKVKLTIPAATTAAYARSAAASERNGMRGVWDLESVDSDLRVIRWLEGSWVMTDEATR